jgi:cell division septal protein FtsQ
VKLQVRVFLSIFIIFAGLVYLFAWSSVFSVKSIKVEGLPAEVSAETLISNANIHVGEKLARIEPRSIKNNVSELSWVNEVAVDRNWISGEVLINVKARVPVGIFRGRVLDSTGVLFDAPGNVPAGLPEVSATTPEIGLEAIALFTSLPLDVRNSIISIDAKNQSTIASVNNIAGQAVKVMWGTSNQIDLKVSAYRALLALPENKEIKAMNLSAPHAPIVK